MLHSVGKLGLEGEKPIKSRNSSRLDDRTRVETRTIESHLLLDGTLGQCRLFGAADLGAGASLAECLLHCRELCIRVMLVYKHVRHCRTLRKLLIPHLRRLGEEGITLVSVVAALDLAIADSTHCRSALGGGEKGRRALLVVHAGKKLYLTAGSGLVEGTQRGALPQTSRLLDAGPLGITHRWR